MAEGISAWVPVITALAGIGGAVGSQYVSHHFTAQREKRASEQKLASQRAFIGSQLMVILAGYSEECSHFSAAPGEESTVLFPRPGRPDFSNIKGDWTALDGGILLRIQRLPLLQAQYERELEEVLDKLSEVEYLPDAARLFRLLADESDRLIKQLMKLCNLPSPWELDE